MTTEDRIQQMLGAKDFQIAILATQLEAAQKDIAELKTRGVPAEPAGTGATKTDLVQNV